MNKLLFVFLFISSISFSQSNIDVSFVKYLADTESYKECIFEVNSHDLSLCSVNVKDSIYYYKGWSEYSLKELDMSSKSLMEVSLKSKLYEKSRLFAAYSNAHLGNYNQSKLVLSNLESSSIVSFQIAGIALLERDFVHFETIMNIVDTNMYYLSAQSQNLYAYSKKLKNHKYKSPILAASLSTIVPGLGKIYAGKTGEGISSFITCLGLGFVACEQNRKNGFRDYRTLIASSLFSLFYVGNIWGSYFTVLISENEFDDEYKNKILFNLHIPLRTFFK